MNTAAIYAESTGQAKEPTPEELEKKRLLAKELEARQQRIEQWLAHPTTQEFCRILDNTIASKALNASIRAVHHHETEKSSHETMVEVGTLFKVKNMIADFNYDK